MIHADRFSECLACADGAFMRAGEVRIALGKRVLRVLQRKLDELMLRSPLRFNQRNLAALSFRKCLRDILRLFRQSHAENFGRRLSAVIVKLHDKLTQHLRAALVARALQRVVLRADHVSAADIDDLDHSVNAVARTGEDILIAAVDVDCLLALHQVLRVADSVTQHRRLFKPHFFRRLIHLFGQAVDDFAALAA